MKPSDVAEVLEKAADLYESEQIDWCKGSWGATISGNREGQFHCAEGAILRAAGYSMKDIIEAQRPIGPINGIELIVSNPLVEAAFGAVSAHWGAPGTKLWRFNDQVLNADKPERAKQELIKVFKETAKELRNGE